MVQQLPEAKFPYVKLNNDETSSLTCAVPIKFDLAKEAANSTIVLVAFPGAFTPTCSQQHVAEFLKKENFAKLIEKGVSKVIFLAANDPFVMQAFAKAYDVQKNELTLKHAIFASDPSAAFSKELGASLDLSSKGMGVRTGRYAVIIKNGKIEYFGNEPGSEVTVSGFKSIYDHL